MINDAIRDAIYRLLPCPGLPGNEKKFVHDLGKTGKIPYESTRHLCSLVEEYLNDDKLAAEILGQQELFH